MENESELWTTSLHVAEEFGKRHDNVIRDIENLGCSEEFSRLNFEETSYQDAQNKPQRMYRISEAGFMMLVMGFTGVRAMKIKEKWVGAFQWMRSQLLQGSEILGIAREIEIIGARVSRLEDNSELAKSELRDLPEPMGVLPGFTNAAVINRVARSYCQLMGCSPGALFASIYSELEFRFGVRITVRKKNAKWKGSTVAFAINAGYGDKIYQMLHIRLKRAVEDLSA